MGAAYIKCLALDLKLWVQCAGWLVPTGPSSLSSALLTPQEADFYGPTTGPLTFCLLRVPRRRLHVFLASLCPPAGNGTGKQRSGLQVCVPLLSAIGFPWVAVLQVCLGGPFNMAVCFRRKHCTFLAPSG